MKFEIGTPGVLGPAVMKKIGEYRHRVFVQTLGWSLPAQGGLEFDQFDRDDTVHAWVTHADGRALGVARLLPTTSPYLLADVFPNLLGDRAPPCSPLVWELSRFAAIDFASRDASALACYSSPTAVQLLRATLAAAALRGADQLVTVSPVGVERLLRKAGFHARRLASPRTIGDHRLFACAIACTPASNPVSHLPRHTFHDEQVA